jgi:hypothetical protein
MPTLYPEHPVLEQSGNQLSSVTSMGSERVVLASFIAVTFALLDRLADRD